MMNLALVQVRYKIFLLDLCNLTPSRSPKGTLLNRESVLSVNNTARIELKRELEKKAIHRYINIGAEIM